MLNYLANYSGNNISNPDLIYPGEQIWVPKGGSAPVNTDPNQGGGTTIDAPVTSNPDPNQGVGTTVPSTISSVAQQNNLGNATSDVIQYSGDVSYQLFEKGSVVSSQYGTFPLYGGIRQEFLNTGGLNGRLAAPTSEEKGLGDGTIIQYFEHGNIYWNGTKAIAYDAESKETPTVQKPSNIPVQISGFNELGSLSEKYETGGRGSDVIGYDPVGGWSYGTYQLATNPGTLGSFVKSAIASKWRQELEPLTPGTQAFNDKWKEIASRDSQEFSTAQHEYIKSTHYDLLASKLMNTLNLDVNQHSKALRDVIWSIAVQHGPNNNVVNNALGGKNISQMSESEIINSIYAERGRKNSAGNLVYFSDSPLNIQQSVANRFVNEQADALAMLQ